MLPHHIRFPSRGPVARRPVNGAMLSPPPPGPAIGAFAEVGQPPQDVVGAVIGELRGSLLDAGTALRLGWVGRRIHYGTETEPPQRFASPSQTNSEDNLRAGVVQSGNARRTQGKNASQGLQRPSMPNPGVMI